MITINNAFQILKDLFHTPFMDEDDVALGMSAIKVLQSHMPLDPREQIKSEYLKRDAFNMMLNAFNDGVCDKEGGSCLLRKAFETLRIKQVDELSLYRFINTQENLIQKQLYMNYIKNGGMEDAQYSNTISQAEQEVIARKMYCLLDEINHNHGIDVAAECFRNVLIPDGNLSLVSNEIIYDAMIGGEIHDRIFEELGLYSDSEEISLVFVNLARKLFDSGDYFNVIRKSNSHNDISCITRIALESNHSEFLKKICELKVPIPATTALHNIQKIYDLTGSSYAQKWDYLFEIELNIGCGVSLSDLLDLCTTNRPVLSEKTSISLDYIENFSYYFGQYCKRPKILESHSENVRETISGIYSMVKKHGESSVDLFISSAYSGSKSALKALLNEKFPNRPILKGLMIEEDFTL